MKSFFLFLIFGMGSCFLSTAQNRSISFEAKDWKKAVVKARKENKLIFLDCYTSWCGPCKNLAKNIFTRDVVADLYNTNFVNVSMDMEKDVDGVMLSKAYKPEAFPTLLFIDPYTELVVHRVTGAGEVQYVLSIAAEALNSENTLAGSCRRYKKGERSPEFVKKLMNDLKLAGVKEMHRQVSEAYFSGLNERELMSQENWELFKVHADNPYAEVFRKVTDHRKGYADLFGDGEVSVALQWVVILELGDIANAMPAVNLTETEARYQKLIDLLNRVEFPGATALLTDLYFSKSLVRSCGNAWRAIQNGYQYNLSGNEFYSMPDIAVWCPLAAFVPSMSDRVILTELLGIVDRIKVRCTSMPYLARLALDKSLILERAGDIEGARQARTEYEQYCSMR